MAKRSAFGAQEIGDRPEDPAALGRRRILPAAGKRPPRR
jgi:hypothetical protein